MIMTDDRRTFLKGIGMMSALAAGCATPSRGPRRGGSTMQLDDMHKRLAAYVERGEIPGYVALVARGDEVQVDAMGNTARGGTVPVRRETIFRVASMTKPVTAAATMILVDDGKLRLDDAVERWLPELANRRVLRSLGAQLDDTVPAARAITVRDLLTFTLGFGIVFAPPGTYPIQRATDEAKLGQGIPAPSSIVAPDEWMKRFGALPLIHQPGARWMYNTGCDVLGVLIARVAGKPFEAFLAERLFGPLGMVDTAFHVPPDKRDRFTVSYVVNPATGAMSEYDPIDGQWATPPAFPSGAGGLVSTVDDFLAFGELLLGRRGHVLSASSIAAIMRDQLTPAQKAASNDFPGFFEAHGWGFGGMVVTGADDSGSPGTYGWDGGLGTSFRVDPERQVVTILLTQRAWTSPVPPAVCRDFWATTRAATQP
jgi:CubicO group peptidase (beta-lactamase class C family)